MDTRIFLIFALFIDCKNRVLMRPVKFDIKDAPKDWRKNAFSMHVKPPCRRSSQPQENRTARADKFCIPSLALLSAQMPLETWAEMAR